MVEDAAGDVAIGDGSTPDACSASRDTCPRKVAAVPPHLPRRAFFGTWIYTVVGAVVGNVHGAGKSQGGFWSNVQQFW